MALLMSYFKMPDSHFKAILSFLLTQFERHPLARYAFLRIVHMHEGPSRLVTPS
jgi:hypothetical protein